VRWVSQLCLGEHNWKPSPEGSIKLNFDGVSKGNPRQTGMGGSNQGQSRKNYPTVHWEFGELNKQRCGIWSTGDRPGDTTQGRNEKCNSGRRFHVSHQHSKETPKWHQSGKNIETLVFGVLSVENSGALAERDHSGFALSGFALGPKVIKWTHG